MASPCQHPTSPLKASRRRAAIDRLLHPELFRAVGDPTRATIMACLVKCGRSCNVTEVAEACHVDFSVVARHLRALATAGLVEARKEGRAVLYRARCAEFCERLRELIAAIEEWCPNMGTATGGDCCCAAPLAPQRSKSAAPRRKTTTRKEPRR